MEISGKIIVDLPEQSGMGKNGAWRSKDYVLETAEQYPRKVCFNLFNDRIDKFPMEVGDDVTVSFDIDSREYNGRWYTSIRAWNVKKNTPDQMPGEMPPPPSLDSAPQQNPEWRNNFDNMDDNDANTNMPF